MGDTYSTNDQVIAEFKELQTGAGSNFTPEKIDAFRDDAFSYINGRIGNKYSTPVPSSAACVAILKTVEVWLVKHRIEGIRTTRMSADDSKQTTKAVNFERKAEDMLDKIIAGTMRMDGATLRTTSDGMSSFNSDSGAEYKVDPDKDQW